MKRIIIAVIFTLLTMAFASPLFSYTNYTQFNKGIAYILMGDKALAVKHLNLFFKQYPDPALKGGFVNLIEANDWEVTKQFKRYLDINHRSVPALVGIALSTTDMANSTSVDNLKRATRMSSSFSAAYLCLGMEYMKIKNYPGAKSYFSKAIKLSGRQVPEYKILLSDLYLLMDKPGNALRLIKPEADRFPDNFYFNYLTARAYLELNQLDAIGKYIKSAIEVNPRNNNAQLLLAKYLIDKKELKRAKNILKALKFKDYNEDYVKTYAHVLLKLKDRNTKNYLDEVYSKKRWDKDINKLMGLFFLGKKNGGNIRNWITRALLSGNSAGHLRELFPGKYEFPEYNYIPFFDVKAVKWISDEMLLVGANKNSGDKDKLFLIRAGDLKVLNVLGYKGRLQDVFFSPDRGRMIFSTAAGNDESVYLYAVDISARYPRPQLVYPRTLPMPSALVGFNKAGSLAYITNSDIASRAFVSPFAIVSEFGKKAPVYPEYPYPVYQYNFVTKRLGRIKNVTQWETIPIEYVKKYMLVYDGYESKNSVQNLIEKGRKLDLTSSEIVKIFFSNDLSAFVIYLSDLNNAFQAVICDSNTNKISRIDETMFLGEGEYAEIQLLNLDPHKKEILLLTKDKNRTLINFNYGSFLYTRFTERVTEYYYDQSQRMLYTLTERTKKRHFTETNLEIFSIKPYLSQTVGVRRDLDRILSIKGEAGVYFSTFDGQLLKMDEKYKFHYLGPSFEGSLYAVSPTNKKTAAFINGRLYIITNAAGPGLWEQKTNLKK